ncbi:hypothetical protein PILCRDRAFT_12053 [Piloderma croceum F 1598]|uniref:Uncharacterized protein n=1 Tax=Piloderma croceum (strain F 1598) TaxID=765440 RepID=A0A0C3EY20_PILCF|nr:hypothetical protein PILCRDRAFT_12053 [Piloderma croceum F 1598]
MSVSTVIPPLPPNATFAERQEYRRVVLKLPGPVDRWVTANSRHPNASWVKEFLMLEDAKTEYVDCVVEAVCVKDPATAAAQERHCKYTLYVTARASPNSLAIPFLRQSPRATRMAIPTVKFQQPKATFVAFFLRMATWSENQSEPGLPYRMVQWARSMMASTEFSLTRYRPVTPPPSHLQLAKNTRTHKR